MPSRIGGVFLCGLLASSSWAWADPRIADVAISKDSFNPSQGQKVELHYALSQADRVTVQVYDVDLGHVVDLLSSGHQGAGRHTIAWDGRDRAGRVVPDQAYFFVIDTDSSGVWDPTTFSGGEVQEIKKATVDRETGTINYELPTAARVLIRLGLKDGPMLKTLVYWEPRVAGNITEYWQGRDEGGLERFWEHRGFTGALTYSTLPESSVVAFGNGEETYREYKLGRAKGRSDKPHRARSLGDLTLRPTGLVPEAWRMPTDVRVMFPGLDGSEQTSGSHPIPEVGEKVHVRLAASPESKQRLHSDQFEVMFFVDHKFFAEAERGYLPLNWVWETHLLPPGEHILTVNISSLKGEVAVASRKVLVKERD